MSSNKRKALNVREFFEDSSPKRRRSSLRVNLSYLSNLSDSNNDSYKTSQHENVESTDASNKKTLSPMSSYKEKFNLKELRVSLVAINEKERSLKLNCEQLKDAIMYKTKQIFDNELSKRTAAALSRDQNLYEIGLENKTNKQYLGTACISPIKKSVYENMQTLIDCPVNSENLLLENVERIQSTPKSTKGTRLLDRSKCRSKRYLFTDKMSTTFSSPVNNANSPILSGSIKHRSFKVPTSFAQLNTIRNTEDKQNVNSIDVIHRSTSNSSIASISENENPFVGNHFVCSTFIQSEHESAEYKDCHEDIGIENHELTKHCAENNVISVERTTVHCVKTIPDSLPGKSKEINLNVQSNCTIIDKIGQQDKSQGERNNSTRSLSLKRRLITMPLSEMNNDNVNDVNTKSTTINKEVPMELTMTQNKAMQENIQQIFPFEDSIKIVPLSLRMNTSIDSLNETENSDNDIELPMRESDQYSIRSSLQVNTSLDCIRKTLPKIINVETLKHGEWVAINSGKATGCSVIEKRTSMSEIEPNNKNRCESLSNTSMKKRGNISTQIQSNCKCNSVEQLEEIEHDNENRIIEKELEAEKNNRKESLSFVEGTPYPPSRSVLLKSQLKQSNMMQNLNARVSVSVQQVLTRSKMKSGSSVHDTIILDDSVYEKSCESENKCIVIEESTDGNKSEENEINQCPKEIENVYVKNKKKLLPLCENDLFSFSPMREQPSQSKPNVELITRRRIKKKSNKINSALGKKNTNTIAQEDLNDFNDCNDLKIKKKQQKKPRKVLSKKIVIKKYANHDLLNELERNKTYTDVNESRFGSNRSSFTEFDTNKRLPTQWRHNKSEKISIVTTGLSKEDKNLVKSIVKCLGGAQIESHVTRRTTHVVSTGIRTINLLHGIIRGCWLVSLEWVLKSLENNKWLNPIDYEMKHFSKAVQENRKDRQLFGPSYVPELFVTCGLVYVKNGTTPPERVLKDLIKSAGGRITEDFRLAKIVIGTEGLKETWIIDSITTGELQPVHQYQRK